MAFGEGFETDMLKHILTGMARGVEIGVPLTYDNLKDECKALVEGYTELWMREHERPSARRIYTSYGSVGNCTCSECKCGIDAIDVYCRMCGAEFTGTDYKIQNEEEQQ